MYREYVEEHHIMQMIPTYRYSQDFIEMLFGKIRSKNGCNDNPTVQQFESSYKKLQLISDILISRYSNVSEICSSNILKVI